MGIEGWTKGCQKLKKLNQQQIYIPERYIRGIKKERERDRGRGGGGWWGGSNLSNRIIYVVYHFARAGVAVVTTNDGSKEAIYF